MAHSKLHHKAPDLVYSVSDRTQRLEQFQSSVSSGLSLKLTNRGENLCFANSAVRILEEMEVINFLLTKLPHLCDPKISTAQELARIYREGGLQSTKHLCR